MSSLFFVLMRRLPTRATRTYTLFPYTTLFRSDRFASQHGPSANAMAFRVKDVGVALKALVAKGVTPVAVGAGPMELQIPAIEGIGGSLIYLVDRYEDQRIPDVDFKPIPGVDQRPTGAGPTYIDHPIGKAAGRESVCPYRSLSVVARTIQKN